MSSEGRIFNKKWLRRARDSNLRTSWATDAIDTLPGLLYLSTLRLWFDKFPLSSKQKRHLRNRLESLENEDHLGGVNELTWWMFMLREGLAACPLGTSNGPCPDFEVESPSHFFVEVTTLNVSQKDKKRLENSVSVPLACSETMRRIIGKFTKEKRDQLRYSTDRMKPCALVIFDYTEWSAYGSLFSKFLVEFLLGSSFGFKKFPPELSALVYVERRVFEGRIAISSHRSAVYYNPFADYSLPVGTFGSFNQYWTQLAHTQQNPDESWLWL